MLKIYLIAMSILAGIIVLAVSANIWLFFRIRKDKGTHAAVGAFFRGKVPSNEGAASTVDDAGDMRMWKATDGPLINPTTGRPMASSWDGSPSNVDIGGTGLGMSNPSDP